MNHLWTLLVASLCLILTFLLVVFLRNLAPYTTESAEMMCDNIDEFFWDDQRFKEEALMDEQVFTHTDHPATGIHHCYCQKFAKIYGYSEAYSAELTSNLLYALGGEHLSSQVCRSWVLG